MSGSYSGILKIMSGSIVGSANTDDLSEGPTNKYFTAARALSAVPLLDIYYHYPVVAGVAEQDIVMNLVNNGNGQAPLNFKKAVNGGDSYYPAIYGVAKNVSGGFADIYVGRGVVVPGFSFGSFVGVEYYIDDANPGKLTWTPPVSGSNPIKIGRALDSTHLTLDPWSNFVQEKGGLYTSDGVYDEVQSVGGNGNVLVANSGQANGLQWAPAVVASAPFTYTTSTRTLTAATSTNSVAGFLSAADHTTFAAKESAITSGTTAQYWRGDKTFQTLNTLAVPELTNLYYTNARVDTEFDIRLATKSTTNLAEGTNQYFTAARAQAAITATAPIVNTSGLLSCNVASTSQAGCLSSSSFTTFNNKFGSVTYTASTPTRSLNTNFTPSASNGVFVSYSIAATCTATISGGQTSTFELRSDPNATPTTVRATSSVGNSVTLAIAITSINTQTAELSYLVPPGHNVRLVSSGTCTAVSIVSQSEVSIAFGQ